MPQSKSCHRLYILRLAIYIEPSEFMICNAFSRLAFRHSDSSMIRSDLCNITICLQFNSSHVRSCLIVVLSSLETHKNNLKFSYFSPICERIVFLQCWWWISCHLCNRWILGWKATIIHSSFF